MFHTCLTSQNTTFFEKSKRFQHVLLLAQRHAVGNVQFHHSRSVSCFGASMLCWGIKTDSVHSLNPSLNKWGCSTVFPMSLLTLPLPSYGKPLPTNHCCLATWAMYRAFVWHFRIFFYEWLVLLLYLYIMKYPLVCMDFQGIYKERRFYIHIITSDVFKSSYASKLCSWGFLSFRKWVLQERVTQRGGLT